MAKFQDKSADYLANQMARLFAAGLHRRIQSIGLAPAQFMVLLELWELDGRTQSDLVGALDVEQATMANTLSRMERDGLITRRASAEDKRARLVYLTDRARKLEAQAKTAAKAQNAMALEGLSKAEVQAFLSLSRKIIANMRRDR